jgi:lipid II:glycine glycyltransferase (peptidoglycan interpeptide bridge formation enzyme)
MSEIFPEPTVLPPSRIENLVPFSIAIGAINSTVISTPAGSPSRALRADPHGIITSSALIIKDKDEVYMIMDGYNTKFKYLNSKHLLVWKLIERYSQEGYKRFNLGGITNPNIEDNKYKGLNEFKLNYNSMVYEYIGDLELVCNETLNFIYNNMNLKSILKI